MNNTPKISVIVPVYNAEKYLSRCIESIQRQVYNNFELLLVNDGSKDDSLTICWNYANKDERIRVFNKKNGGVCSARNLGLANVRGEWIAFCDSDDWVKNNWLKDFIDYSSNQDLVCQGFFCENHFKKMQGKVSLPTQHYSSQNQVCEFLYQMISLSLLGYPWCKLYKTSIIKEAGIYFNESFFWKEDEEFVLRYCQYVKSIYNLSVTNYQYYYERKKYRDQDHFLLWESIYKSLNNIYSDYQELFLLIKKQYLLGYFIDSIYKMYNFTSFTKKENITRMDFIKYHFVDEMRQTKNNRKVKFTYLILFYGGFMRNIIFRFISKGINLKKKIR